MNFLLFFGLVVPAVYSCQIPDNFNPFFLQKDNGLIGLNATQILDQCEGNVLANH